MLKKRTFNSFVKELFDGMDDVKNNHIDRMLYWQKSLPFKINECIDIMLIDNKLEAILLLRKYTDKKTIEYNALIYLLTGNVTFKIVDI
jgi:hypothetical protein